MPVTRLGVHTKHLPHHHFEQLERRLLDEWRASPSQHPRPDIIEETDGTKTIRAFVIWDEWKSLSPEERAEVIQNGFEQFYGEAQAKELDVAMGLTPIEAQGLGMTEFKLFPSLDQTDPELFADKIRDLAEMYGESDLDTIADRALLLAEYAARGTGLMKDDVETLAEDLAFRVDYSPIDCAPEDKIGIVFIGAVARAKLQLGSALSLKELHVLASLSPKPREHIASDPSGLVSNERARAYLDSQEVEL